MTKILSMIFYLKQEEFVNLLNFAKLKNIFLIFRNINFDTIHEVVIHLIKNLIVNRINEFHNNNNSKKEEINVNNFKNLTISGKKSVSNNYFGIGECTDGNDNENLLKKISSFEEKNSNLYIIF